MQPPRQSLSFTFYEEWRVDHGEHKRITSGKRKTWTDSAEAKVQISESCHVTIPDTHCVCHVDKRELQMSIAPFENLSPDNSKDRQHITSMTELWVWV